MKFIGFRDSCVISRPTGQSDDWENPVTETIYTGECLYEEAGSGASRSIVTRNPTVYLPENDAIVKINDIVKVTTEKGRVIDAIVEIVRDINMPWRANIKLTKIELKQSHGD